MGGQVNAKGLNKSTAECMRLPCGQLVGRGLFLYMTALTLYGGHDIFSNAPNAVRRATLTLSGGIIGAF